MVKRTLCFTTPVRLSLSNRQIVITTRDNATTTRPVEDVGVVVLENLESTITTALLAYLTDNNVAVVTCDQKHMPSGLLLPLAYNSMPGLHSMDQIHASKPLMKQLWQQTVVAKINNQAALLRANTTETTTCMTAWANAVKSGDSDNLEARAAIFYWHNLFDKSLNFKRGDERIAINSLLDYGYAVLRAIIARALVAAGLIPTLGIFHSNKYNGYCLADDIMEPYRPYVDRLVLSIIKEHGTECELTREVKSQLLTVPVLDVKIGRLTRPLMIAATMTAASLVKCYSGENRKILYPIME